MGKMKEKPLDYFLSTCCLLSGLSQLFHAPVPHPSVSLAVYSPSIQFGLISVQKGLCRRLYFELFPISPAGSAKD